jgi:hypothetical protein
MPGITDPRLSSPSPPPMLIPLNIDCGTVVPGHRVILVGLSDGGRSRNDLSRDHDVECQMVSLEYDLVPGVDPGEVADGFDERFMVQASYRSDVELPWTTAGDSGTGPGGIELFAGGPRTHGTLGPWPVPDGARTLTFVFYRPPTSTRDSSSRVAGTVDIDLVARTARWSAAEA